MRRIATFVVLGVLGGCARGPGEGDSAVQRDTLPNGTVVVTNPDRGVWERTGAGPWTLVEDLRIGRMQGDGPDVFGAVRSVIPRGDSLIWVLDGQAFEFHAFDGQGRHLRTIGGSGDGPGEFGRNPCAHDAPGDEIWVESGGRWQRFGPDGELRGGQSVTRSLGCGAAAWRGDEFLASFATFDPATFTSTGFLIVHDRAEDGSVMPRDTVPTPDVPEGEMFQWLVDGRPRIQSLVPFVHNGRYSLQPSGDFLVWDGGSAYRFRKQTPWGDTLLIVEKPHTPTPIAPETRDAALDDLDREDLGLPDDYDTDRVPTDFPPFQWLREADDGSVWAQRQVAEGALAFDVFDRDGAFLGTITLPDEYATLRVQRITESHIFGVVRDEFDVEFVVRLVIEKPPETP